MTSFVGNFQISDQTLPTETVPFQIEENTPTNTMFLSEAGNVGIGTATPSVALEVAGQILMKASNGFLKFDRASTGADLSMRFSTGETMQWQFVQAANTSQDLHLQRAGSIAVMTFDQAAGRIGIGTTNPTDELHVNGNIRANGSFISGSTTLNVPDYVFEPDYLLMPLPELATFIAHEKRLPNVPSAAEISETGVNMTDMQMTLLAKVEELTLYTIEQDKTITGQEQALIALAATIQELAVRLAVVEQSVSPD